MSSSCTACLTSKAPLICSQCQDSLCKNCAIFIDENSHPYLSLFHKKIPQGPFCPNCYQANLQQDIEEYESLETRARNVEVFYRRLQGKETRLMERIEPQIVVEGCNDEQDVLMHLAFAAVQKNAPYVVDIEVFSEKQKDGSYTLVTWRGSGYPARK